MYFSKEKKVNIGKNKEIDTRSYKSNFAKFLWMYRID